MSISIFTITHVPFTPPANPIYIPLQVGRSTHTGLGYLGDNSGENISDKNKYYSELTGLYWIWKNYTNADYLGLCHYRRFFLNANDEPMTEQDYMDILTHYDVMISKAQIGEFDYQTIYGRSHDIHNLIETGNVIRELFPEYYSTFQEVLKDNRCYVGNLFVAPRELFCAYCEWLFTIFFELEKRIDVTDYDDYHMRVFGFLSEQLLIVWIKHNKLSYHETVFGLNQEKAETIQLKETLKKYIAEKNINGAYSHLCKTLDKRPDLLLEMSDFNQDLKIIEHILNICRIELSMELPTMLSLSTDLDLLIKHFRLVLHILEKIQANDVEETELQYLIDCHISYKALVYMLQNFKQFHIAPLELLNQLAAIYVNANQPLIALSFLEEAIAIQETDRTTLSNIVSIFDMIGHDEMAKEYRQLLASLTSHKRIVVFTGSDIPILEYIASNYIEALTALGHSVLVFDKKHFEESMNSLFLYHEKGLDAAIVLNNACFQMRLQSGESLWDVWKVPCFNILVDHPMYYFDTLDNSPAYGIVACADQYHEDYIKQFYPTVQNSIFLPTAGQCLKSFNDLKPFSSRTIDVLFIGSYKYHDDVVYDDFDQLLEQELMTNPYITFEQAVQNCLSIRNTTLSPYELKEFIQSHRFVDVNTTAIFRKRIIETLIENGISVTVYGNGWDSLSVFQHPNFIYKGLVSPKDGIRLMEDSKIVLNHMAWFKHGTSERIHEAMLQGAIALTDGSEYLSKCYENEKHIAYYELNHLEELPQIVKKILVDDTTSTAPREHMRKAAYLETSANHTWLNRTKKLLDTLP